MTNMTPPTDEEFETIKNVIIGYSQAQAAGFRPLDFFYMTGLEWLDQISILKDPLCLLEAAPHTPFGFRKKSSGKPIWVVQPDFMEEDDE